VAGVAALTGVARADSYTLRLEPGVSLNDTRVRDASGATQTSETRTYTGLYQLSLQKDLYESIRFNGTATLQDTQGRATVSGISSESDSRSWNTDANLAFGREVLSGAIGYSRNDTSSSTRSSTDPFALVQPSIVRETWAASGRWTPLELPTLEGRLSRDTVQSVGIDQRSVLAALNSSYKPTEQLRLTGSLAYTNGRDNLIDVETSALAENANVTYGDTFFGRTSVFTQAQLSHTSTSIRAGTTSGAVKTPRLPVEGLSLVEAFTDQPERDTLRTNTLVIDGDVDTSAGLNIGFGPTLPPANDQAFRDVAVRLVERDPVNLIEVWVDERLPTGVSSAYVWSVYRSEDNLTWTELAISGPVLFHPVENHFDIPIVPFVPATASSLLKVVTRPISSAVSADPRFRDVAITEMKTFLVQPAEDVRGRTSVVGATFSGAAGTRILDVPSLRHDLSTTIATTNWEEPRWQVTNGLALAHRLSPKTSMAANVIRSDSGDAERHVWRFQYGASLTSIPLPTLTTGAAFSGYLAPESSRGNGVSAFARAALYPGVDVSANTGYNVSRAPDDRTTQSVSATGATSIIPVRWLSFNGGAVTSQSRATGGGLPDATSRSTRLDSGMAFHPFPALFFSAGVSRIFGTSVRATTLVNFGATYSPFREGALLLSLGHSQNFETATNTRSRVSSASSRWNFASWAFVEASYALLDTETLQVDTHAQSISARLAVTL
jgi:hypothetical protein